VCPDQFSAGPRSGRWGGGVIKDCGELEIDQAKSPVAHPVGDVAHLGIVVADAELLELGEKFFEAVVVKMLDPAPATRRNHPKVLGVGLKEPWHERTFAVLKILQDADFVGESLFGLGAAELLMDAAIISHAHRRAQSVLHFLHARLSPGGGSGTSSEIPFACEGEPSLPWSHDMGDNVRFQHYEVGRREDGSLDELGRGAMGVTYRAFDTNLKCNVALKVISSAYLGNEVAHQRFLREARAAAALRHPNVAAVFHLGEEGGDCFYAMEFVEGETVEALMKRCGPIPVTKALNIALQVARALGAAEKQGLVHRDLKPTNLMLTTEEDGTETVKVIDFGLAKNAAGGGNDDAATLTLAGFLGTPHFASPEQLEEREIDIRSDIYSLGVTLFYMLAGRAPFSGSLAQVMSQHLQREPPMEMLAGVPPSVTSLLRRMMAKDAADRPQTAADLRTEISACLATCDSPGQPPQAAPPVVAEEFETQVLPTMALPETAKAPPKRRLGWVIAFGVLILALLGTFAVMRTQDNRPTATASPTPTPAPIPTPDPFAQGLAQADELTASNPAAGLTALLNLKKSSPASEELAERISKTLAALRETAATLTPDQTTSLHSLLDSAALEEFPEARVILAEQLEKSNPDKALKLFISSAGQGNIDAMLLAADMLADGRGVKEPQAEAAAVWFQKAADAGDPRGIYLLAECKLRGKGVKKDEAGAVELLTEASTKKEPRAMNLLGRLYQKGIPGVLVPDSQEALRLFSSAKDAGFLDAQGNLGVLYLNGEGVTKNDRVAAELFHEGAEKNNPLCMYFYAMCLEMGVGTPQDKSAARDWYVRSALAGNERAKEWCRSNNEPLELPRPQS